MLSKNHLQKGTLSIPIGINADGEVVKVALNDMPHILIAGATGSGKSVMLHTVLHALTEQMTSKEMHLLLIDPKRVELVAFAKKAHLKGGKIAYEYEDAVLILTGMCDEMESRYKILEKAACRDIREYNVKAEGKADKFPYVVLVVDEFADLIYQGKAIEKKKKGDRSLRNIVERVKVEQMARTFAKMGVSFKPKMDDKEQRTVEEMLARLAAMGRAAGIHLVITTQRPSVDVITGLIKANFPTRIALTVSSPADSKVILGTEGAEKLNGKGDMLFMSPGHGLRRLQGLLSE